MLLRPLLDGHPAPAKPDPPAGCNVRTGERRHRRDSREMDDDDAAGLFDHLVIEFSFWRLVVS